MMHRTGVRQVPLAFLAHLSPLLVPPWFEMGHDYSPITLDEVLRSERVSEFCALCSREDHLGRIHHFMSNGWNDAIEIDLTSRIWPISDGNHRLAAAFLMGAEAIQAVIIADDEVQADDFLAGIFVPPAD